MISLPLDIWHGDDDKFVAEVKELFPVLKTASLCSSDQLESMHDNDFGLVVIKADGPSESSRFFPRHDPLHAMTSLFSLMKHKKMMPENMFNDVAGKITISIPVEMLNHPVLQKILALLGIGMAKEASEGPVVFLDTQMADAKKTVKEASIVPKNFVLDTGDKKYVPIDTPLEVKEACLYFSKEANDLNPAVFEYAYHKLANRIHELGMKKAEHLPDYKTSVSANVEILKRAKLCHPTHKEDYLKLYRTIDYIPTLKLASVIGALDQATGINKLWGHQVKHPHEAVTDIMKVAYYIYQDPETKAKITEEQLLDAASKEKVLEEIKKYLGKEFVDQFKTLPVDMFKHLPERYKKVVAKAINKKFPAETKVVIIEQGPTLDTVAGFKQPAGGEKKEASKKVKK